MVGKFTLRWRWEQGDSHWHSISLRQKHQFFINKTIFLNHSEQNTLYIHPRDHFLPSLVTLSKTLCKSEKKREPAQQDKKAQQLRYMGNKAGNARQVTNDPRVVEIILNSC